MSIDLNSSQSAVFDTQPSAFMSTGGQMPDFSSNSFAMPDSSDILGNIGLGNIFAATPTPASTPTSGVSMPGNDSFIASLLAMLQQMENYFAQFSSQLFSNMGTDLNSSRFGSQFNAQSSGNDGGLDSYSGSNNYSGADNYSGSDNHSRSSSHSASDSNSSSAGGLMSGRHPGIAAFQANSGDSLKETTDPLGQRGKVVAVNFTHGAYTTHSTSPRAEAKVAGNLREGANYSYQFGFMRGGHNSTTFFQVLDNNGAKPSPRAWLAVKGDHYVLHLREGSGSGSRVMQYDLGPASNRKWDDIRIDYRRGIGNGAIAVSINGRQAFAKQGISTMYDTHSPAYVKFGQYRNQGDHSPGTVYFSNFTQSGG